MSNLQVKPAARISPEHPLLAWLVVILILGLSASAFSASFVSLSAVAAASGLAAPGLPRWLPWTLPIALDAAIMTYTVGAVLKKARGESARFAYWCLGAFTAVSTSLNVAHVVEAQGFQVSSIIPSVALGLMPLSLMLSVHMLVSVVVAPPEAHGEPPVEEAVVAPGMQDKMTPAVNPSSALVPVQAPNVVAAAPEQVPAAPLTAVPVEASEAAPAPIAPEVAEPVPQPSEAPAAALPTAAKQPNTNKLSKPRKPTTKPAGRPAAHSGKTLARVRPMTEQDLPEAIRMTQEGLSRQRVADALGVSKSAVTRAIQSHESKAVA